MDDIHLRTTLKHQQDRLESSDYVESPFFKIEPRSICMSEFVRPGPVSTWRPYRQQ